MVGVVGVVSMKQYKVQPNDAKMRLALMVWLEFYAAKPNSVFI